MSWAFSIKKFISLRAYSWEDVMDLHSQINPEVPLVMDWTFWRWYL